MPKEVKTKKVQPAHLESSQVEKGKVIWVEIVDEKKYWPGIVSILYLFLIK